MTGPGQGPSPGRTPAQWLGRYPEEHPPVSTAGAAVTIVLREGLHDVEVLLIERAANPADPASGQVALPGGHVNDGDGSLEVTAARELEEEVGLTLADLAGPLRYVETVTARRFGLRVGVFATELASGGARPTARSAEEVAHVFWLPRATLEATRRIERETHLGSADVTATVHEGHVLWGFTRRVLRRFFELPTEDEVVGPVLPPHPDHPP